MKSEVTIKAPSGAGKTQFRECLAKLVKLFYGDAATLQTDGVRCEGGAHTDYQQFTLDMASTPSLAHQRNVARFLEDANQGALVIRLDGVQDAEALTRDALALLERHKEPVVISESVVDSACIKACALRFDNAELPPFGGFPCSPPARRLDVQRFVGTQNMGHAVSEKV